MTFESAVPVPGAEAQSFSGSSKGNIRIVAAELSEGERAEVTSEAETLGTSLAMPLTLISPMAKTADDGNVAWGLVDIGAGTLDKMAGSGVRVAVLDTGIDVTHEAFDGIDLETENFTDEGPEDSNGHGTHCAGTIFGQDVNGRRIGIARGVRNPLIGKVLGRGGGDSEAIFNALLWAQRKKAQVVSMSLGFDFPTFRERLFSAGKNDREATSIALQAYRENVRLFDKISDIFAHDTILSAPLLIAAAGNESVRPEYTIAAGPPAVADDVLSVAALDRNQTVALFSNTGPDCCAPGVDILSAKLGGGVELQSGTSMASPHVAGVAVLEAAKIQASGEKHNARLLRAAVLARAAPIVGLSRSDIGHGKIVV